MSITHGKNIGRIAVVARVVLHRVAIFGVALGVLTTETIFNAANQRTLLVANDLALNVKK